MNATALSMTGHVQLSALRVLGERVGGAEVTTEIDMHCAGNGERRKGYL